MQERVQEAAQLPLLQAAEIDGRAAITVLDRVCQETLEEWWTQPGLTATPWVTVEGKNSSEWRRAVQQLNASLHDKHVP